MHADAFYAKGWTHANCQDYAAAFSAIHSEDGEPQGHHYAIISDGCSSAKDTDLGARLLVRAAHCESGAFGRMLAALESDGGNYTGRVDEIWKEFVVKTTTRAAMWADAMEVAEEALSATLLVACGGPKWCFTASYGDGCHVVSRVESGQHITEVCIVEFMANYPAYPLYAVNERLGELFAAVEGNSRKSLYTDDAGGLEERIGGGPSQVFCYPSSDVAFLAVGSDGVGSCGSLPAPAVAMNLTNFKNFTGEFVKRRATRALEECAKAGQNPADDVSIGAVVVGYGKTQV